MTVTGDRNFGLNFVKLFRCGIHCDWIDLLVATVVSNLVTGETNCNRYILSVTEILQNFCCYSISIIWRYGHPKVTHAAARFLCDS